MSTDPSPRTEERSPRSEDRPAPRSRRRQLTVVSVAAAVLLAAGGGAYWASTASSSNESDTTDTAAAGAGRPKLALDGTAASAHGDGEGIAPGEPMGPRGYRAEGELPDGPRTAAVRRTGHEVTEDQVAKLAAALHLKGAVKAEDDRWRVGGGPGDGARLTAERGKNGGAWTYQNGGTVPLDADATPEPDPAPRGKPLSEKKAKDAVRPALRALGLEDASLKAGSPVGSTRTVTASPKVAGLPTHGWDTTFVVDEHGTVTRAQGSWNQTHKGAAYPVLSASATLDRLNKASQSRGGHTGEGAGNKPTTIGDARFGLSLERSHGRPLLVPAWLYEVKRKGGGDLEVTHPAVDPKYLKPSRTSGHPSAPEAHKPGKGDHSEGTGPGRHKTAQAIESYSAEGRTLTVHFWGGVCDAYKATTEETGDRVEVKLDAKPKQDGKNVCVKIAKRQTVQVELDKKLGDRKVVDARDGRKLPHK